MRKTSDTMHTAKCNTLAQPSTTAHRLTLGALLCATLALGACATLDLASPESQVTKRANERWQALLSADFGRAYTYNTPSFRTVVTADTYRSRIGAAVKWLGAEAVKVDCPETTKCTATVRIDYRPLLGNSGAGKFSTHIDESWLLEDGQWWVFQPIQGN